MSTATHTEQYNFGGRLIQLVVPDYALLQQNYLQQQLPAAPFWAKLWPSSLALCHYLEQHPFLIRNKTIMEIGAGLGLPSLLAAYYAAKVICTDNEPEAVRTVQQSVLLNGLQNIECREFDWRYAGSLEASDVILLSDINYNPSDFPLVMSLLKAMLAKQVEIILSTPQRLMAKPFIEQLLPFCVEKTTIPVKTATETAEIFIMRLQKQG
ncbi:MAG: methyltransferase [Ferruginibacter sp.]